MPLVQATDVPSTVGTALVRAPDLPNVYSGLAPNANVFGALEGAAQEQFGQTLERAANLAAERAIDLQKIHNNTVVSNANTQFMKETTDDLFGSPGKPGYYATKGLEAQYQYDTIRKNLDTREKAIMDSLQNDAQRLAFQHETRYQRRWLERDIGSHYQKETTKANEDAAKAGFSVAAQTAGRNYNDPERHKDGLLAADDLARKEAHGDPTIELALRNKYRDQVYVEIAHGYATQNDWDGARKWFDANKQYISDPKISDTINQHIHDKSIDADVINKFLLPGGAPGAGGTDLFSRIVSRGERSTQGQVSPAGATGKAQMLPETAQEAARLAGIPWDENRFRTDEAYNLQLGKAHLDRLMRRYGGSEILAAAAYNAGEGRVDQWIRDFGDPRAGTISEKDFAEKIPIAETRDYVKRVIEPGVVEQRQAGATRNLPISARVNVQLERAATAVGNLKVEVFSGGQPRSGPNRVGSHRHDEGEAADIQLRDTMTGKLLDMRNPGDRMRMQQFITAAVAAGATGVGAAEGYMGPHGIHIGGGTPAAWGADGTSASAPDWVRAAWEAGRGVPRRAAATVPQYPQFLAGNTPPPGMLEVGNIDLGNPRLRGRDGSISSSMSFNEDGKEVLIPTMSEDGSRTLSAADAIAQYKTTKQFIGKFDTPENATAYAQQVADEQAKRVRITPLAGAATPVGDPTPLVPGTLTPPPDPTPPPVSTVPIPTGAPPTPPPVPGAQSPPRDMQADMLRLRELYPNPTDFVKAFTAYQRIISMENAAAHQKHVAEQAISEEATKGYLDQIIKGDYAGVLSAIPNDPKLTAANKLTLYNAALHAQNQDVNKFAKTHGTGFWDVWRRVFAEPGDPNRITDVNQILQMADEKGYLTVSGAKELAAQLTSKKTPQGEADSQLYNQLFKDAHQRLTVTGLEALGIHDPIGEGLHNKFMQQALPEIVKLRAAGRPMNEIADLDNGPLSGILKPLIRDPATIFQNYMTRIQQMGGTITPQGLPAFPNQGARPNVPAPGSKIIYGPDGQPKSGGTPAGPAPPTR